MRVPASSRPRFAPEALGRDLAAEDQTLKEEAVNLRRSLRQTAVVLAGLGFLGMAEASAQQAPRTGTISGTVLSAEDAQPLPGTQVVVQGTRLGTVTQASGRYVITDVPVGTYTVVAQMIGRAPARVENVRVAEGTTVAANFQLRTQVLSIEEIVVTGVVDPVSGTRLPFTVSHLGAEQMPVPQTTAPIAALQGRVPGVTVGRGSGQPGSGVSIQLRTPTSIVRSNNPLIVVDGAILAANAVDIESLDIESMEVVKGAAAASLYGSRAASGVIQIRTRRGSDLALNNTRIVARTEYGNNQVARRMPMANYHHWQVNAQGEFLDANGNPTTDRAARATQPIHFMDQAWGVATYDHLGQFFTAGDYRNTSGTISQNLGNTNWLASMVNTREAGVLLTNEGLTRNSLRMNLDHRLRDNFSLGFSGYHMRSERDELTGTTTAGAFFDLLLLPPDVDLLKRDPVTGNLIPQPDSTLAMENPIWRQTSRDFRTWRMRTLANANARFQPVSGLTFESDLSYDRSDRELQQYVPKGTPAVNNLTGLDGTLLYQESQSEQVNGSLGATFLRRFGDLTTRTTARGSIERELERFFWVQGDNFLFLETPRIGATRDITGNSGREEVKANGYFLHTGLDYQAKYIGDLLIRRDGSSLFGQDARWNNYYRASAAYRLSQEPWWPLASITEFKLNASVGTAGGRPEFSDRFETVSVSGTTGAVTRSNLGNRNLRPEHTTEREFGLTAAYRNRYSLQLARAFAVTRDQIVQIPQPAVSGFFAQWLNSGVMEGRTF
jgi:TonB-dependent SusC/RagA subfamily outer membrane receptor